MPLAVGLATPSTYRVGGNTPSALYYGVALLWPTGPALSLIQGVTNALSGSTAIVVRSRRIQAVTNALTSHVAIARRVRNVTALTNAITGSLADAAILADGDIAGSLAAISDSFAMAGKAFNILGATAAVSGSAAFIQRTRNVNSVAPVVSSHAAFVQRARNLIAATAALSSHAAIVRRTFTVLALSTALSSVPDAVPQRFRTIQAALDTVSGHDADATVVLAPVGILFVGGASTNKAGSTSGTNSIPLNSGLTGGLASAVSDGDFVIAAFATGSTGDRTLSLSSSGYTLAGSELFANSTNDTNLRVMYKFVSGDTGVSFNSTGNNAEAGAMTVLVFRNVNTTTPLDVAVTTATNNGNGNRPTPPAITPTTTGAVVVTVGAGAHANNNDPYTSGGNMDYWIEDIGEDNIDIDIGAGYAAWTSGTFTPTGWGGGTGSASDSWVALTMALRPA